MEIIGIQMDIAWENRSANHARVSELVTRAAPPRGSLVVLPEMFATGFSMNVSRVTDSPAGDTQMFLQRLAREGGFYVMGGIVSTSGSEAGRNQCVAYSPEGTELARYTKLHPFSPGRENHHYEPGKELSTFQWGPFRVAPFICYDLRFPEIFRLTAKRGATLLVIIANWPAQREHHWATLLQARAIENQAFVIGVNRVGEDPSVKYSGRTLIVGPDGEVLADGGKAEGAVRATLDRKALEAYRSRLPFLQDMRAEFVG